MTPDVLCLSHLRWNFVYQRPQHLMTRWARERRVFYFEEPVFDVARPRLTVTQDASARGVYVAVPHLPRGTSAEEIDRLQRSLLDRLVGDAHVRDPLVWLYTPMAIGFTRHVRRSLTVYDCMDELSAFHAAPPLLRQRERELFGVADLVFTGGHSLYEAKRAHHPSVHAFPSSVDAEHFASARTLGRPREPADQRDIPHPRLGFVGVIDERCDMGLLRRVAELRPDFHLVLAGPVAKIDPRAIPRLPNIHCLGQKKYGELPAYLASWDVAIMPFALNDATRYISPTKTLEYFAAGKPVVSTPIHDVVRPYGERGLVRIARDARELVAAVDAALLELGTRAGEARRAACDAFVAQTSWDSTWSAMNALVRHATSRRSRAEKQEPPCSTT
jgi:glycosyltransferase involved in cell wall biosynthesis